MCLWHWGTHRELLCSSSSFLPFYLCTGRAESGSTPGVDCSPKILLWWLCGGISFLYVVYSNNREREGSVHDKIIEKSDWVLGCQLDLVTEMSGRWVLAELTCSLTHCRTPCLPSFSFDWTISFIWRYHVLIITINGSCGAIYSSAYCHMQYMHRLCTYYCFF